MCFFWSGAYKFPTFSFGKWLPDVMIGEGHCAAYPDLSVGGEAGLSPRSSVFFFLCSPFSSLVFLVRNGQAGGRGQAGWQALGNRANVLYNNSLTPSDTLTHTVLKHTAAPLCFSNAHIHTGPNVISFGWVIWQRLSFCLTYLPALKSSSAASR